MSSTVEYSEILSLLKSLCHEWWKQPLVIPDSKGWGYQYSNTSVYVPRGYTIFISECPVRPLLKNRHISLWSAQRIRTSKEGTEIGASNYPLSGIIPGLLWRAVEEDYLSCGISLEDPELEVRDLIMNNNKLTFYATEKLWDQSVVEREAVYDVL